MRKWIKRLKLIKPNGKKGQCLTRRQLLGYAEGTLSEREEAHVERHMQECPPCERMATVFRRYAEMPDLDFEIEDLLEHPNFKRLLDAVESFDERPLGISQEMFKIIERRARALRSSKAPSQVREWVMKLMEAWRLATWAVSRRWLAAVLVAIVSIPALVVLMLMWPGKSNLEQGMLALTEAYRGHRPVEARLSGGFPHAPAPKRPEEKRDRGLEWLFYAPYEPLPRPGQTAAKEKVFNAAVTDKFLERKSMDEILRLCDVIRETSFAIHRFHRNGHLEKIYENALAHRLRKVRGEAATPTKCLRRGWDTPG